MFVTTIDILFRQLCRSYSAIRYPLYWEQSTIKSLNAKVAILTGCGEFFRIPALPLNNFMTSGFNANFSPKEFLNPDELAELLAISRATVYRMIAKRQIAFIKVGGGLRFRRNDVDKYLENNRVNPLTQ